MTHMLQAWLQILKFFCFLLKTPEGFTTVVGPGSSVQAAPSIQEASLIPNKLVKFTEIQ